MRRITTARLRNAATISAKVAAVYSRQPSRLTDLPKWIRQRRMNTVEARVPWWPFAAIEAMQDRVQRGSKVFEFGGGGSSLWFHDLGAELTVVEHDAPWYRELSAVLGDKAQVLLRLPTRTGTHGSRFYPDQYFDSYVEAIETFDDESLDIVVVDGRSRVACGFAAISKVKHGGLLILDDSNRERYSPLVSELADWRREDYRGVKPGGIGPPRRTTVWQKP